MDEEFVPMQAYLNKFCKKHNINIDFDNLTNFPMHIYLNQETGN